MEITKENFLSKMFINEAKPALDRHSGGGAGGSGGGAVVGPDVNMDELIPNTIKSYRDSRVYEWAGYVFRGFDSLITVDMPQCTKLGMFMFADCTSLTTVNIPLSTGINSSAFKNCHSLQHITTGDLEIIYGNAFANCTSLTDVRGLACTDVGERAFENCTGISIFEFKGKKSNDTIAAKAFKGCSSLIAFICRCELTSNNSSSVPTMYNDDAFEDTPIANGNGYIYVPSKNLSNYKSANEWSTYANQFRALEDYTVDGTISGELDETKI